MSLYDTYRDNQSSFRAMTGLNPDEFDALLLFFDEAWMGQMEDATIQQKFRWIRRYVPYKNSPLPRIEDKLFFILVYIKQYPTQTLHGALFGMAQPNANKWIHILMPALFQALAAYGMLPATNADELHGYFDRHPEEFFLSMT